MHSINIQPMQNNGGSGRLTAHKTAIEKTPLQPLKSVDSGVRAAQAEAPRGSAAQGQLAALFKTLGLPADRLSHAIISFAKFFSLPLEPRLLLNVRKASMAQPDSRAPTGQAAQIHAGADPAAILNSRQVGLSQQALALAALAAADKGVSLSPAALEEYAAAIDPDQQDAHGGQPDGGGDAEDRGGAQRDSSPEQRDERRSGTASADPALLLKERFCESVGSSPALDLLNRLPGRNGRRWLTFPLSFTENGVQFRVSLRILLDGDSGASYAVRRMSLDIAQRNCEQSGAEQRWLFILDREKPDSAGNSQEQSRLTVLLRPSRSHGALKSLAKKLSRCVDLPIKSIVIRNYRDSDFAADSRDDELGTSKNFSF